MASTTMAPSKTSVIWLGSPVGRVRQRRTEVDFCLDDLAVPPCRELNYPIDGPVNSGQLRDVNDEMIATNRTKRTKVEKVRAVISIFTWGSIGRSTAAVVWRRRRGRFLVYLRKNSKARLV
jgi:hypothetical protein